MKKEVVIILLFLVIINVSLVSANNEILLKLRHFIPAEGISDVAKAKIYKS